MNCLVGIKYPNGNTATIRNDHQGIQAALYEGLIPSTKPNAEQEECGRRRGHRWEKNDWKDSEGGGTTYDYWCQSCLLRGIPAK